MTTESERNQKLDEKESPEIVNHEKSRETWLHSPWINILLGIEIIIVVSLLLFGAGLGWLNNIVPKNIFNIVVVVLLIDVTLGSLILFVQRRKYRD